MKINVYWQRQKINKVKKTSVSELVKRFFEENEEMKQVSVSKSDEQKNELYWALISLIYSNRYKKQDEFKAEMNIDFTHIRQVLYKYNDESKAQLLSDPSMSALFHNFCINGRDSL